MVFAAAALVVSLAFFVVSVLMVIGSKGRLKDANGIVQKAEDIASQSQSSCALAEEKVLRMREELDQRIESHERVVGVLIKERDRWRDAAAQVDEAHDGTVLIYQRTILTLQNAKGRQMDEKDKRDMKAATQAFFETLERKKRLPVSDLKKVEEESGWTSERIA